MAGASSFFCATPNLGTMKVQIETFWEHNRFDRLLGGGGAISHSVLGYSSIIY